MSSDETIIHIIADSRETRSKVLNALKAFPNVKIEIQPLEAGDYVVSDRVAISLKASISDFCKSLSSGTTGAPHLFDELIRLKDAYERPVFILNGVMSFDFANNRSFMYRPISKHGKIVYAKVDLHRPPMSLLGAISAILRMGIAVVRTANEFEAANLIYAIARQEQVDEKRPLRIQKAKKAGLALHERQRLVVESLAEGIGPKLAEALLTHFKTVRAIVNADESQLKEVEGIGDERARRIIQTVSSTYQPVSEEDKGSSQ